MMTTTSLLIFATAFVSLHVVTCSATAPTPTSNVVPHHSLVPPFLSTYAENGLAFWSFGGATVITDTAAILTPPVGSGHGYLWNQQPSGLHDWVARFVVKATKKPPFSVFSTAPCEECGIAFWHLREPSRHEQVHFFGVPDRFRGFGVILRHDGVHVVQNDGSPVRGLDAVKVGGCAMNALTLRGAELILEYSIPAATLRVLVGFVDSEGFTVGTPRLCAELNRVPECPRHYFGFTALSVANSERGFELTHVEVASMGLDKDDVDSNSTAVSDFDAKVDKEDRQFWATLGGDVDPQGRR